MAEEWKAIPGVERYMVSNEGRVARVLKSLTLGDNYFDVCLPTQPILGKRSFGSERKGHGGFRVAVHILVALAFLGEPNDEQTVVNHKDGYANEVNNLEWSNQQANSLHGWNRKRDSGATGFNVSNDEIAQMRALHGSGMSVRQIAKLIGRHQSTVAYWLRKKAA